MSEKEIIDNDLIFSRFGSLSNQRDALYFDFVEIDEKNEISDAWVKFSCNVVNDLLSVIGLTKSLYDRLVDGLRRSNKPATKEELYRIKNLTEFWLDLSIMSYLYATIEKRGLFGEKGSDKVNQLGYVETKKSIDELTLLAFQAGQEFFTQDARITLGEELFLAQEKQRLDYLDDMDGENNLKLKTLGEYDLKQAHFLITRVKNSFIKSSSTWWWKDPIAMYSLSQHTIEHINSMNMNWSKSTSDYIKRGVSFTDTIFEVTKAFSNLSLAQHYKRLGIAALRKRALSIAADYFNLAVNLTDELPIENIDMRENIEFWGTSAHLQWLIYKQMSVLSMISADYRRVLDALASSDLDLVKLIINTNLEKLAVVLESGDVAYLTSVAVTYETVFSYLDEQIRGDYNLDELVLFIETRIKITSDRLHKATHQLSSRWIKIINKEPDNLEALLDVVNSLEAPMLALLVLPPDDPSVIGASSEILAIMSATDAMIMTELANLEFGTNPVKEMLERSKAYKLSEYAANLLVDLKDDETTDLIRKLIEPLKSSSLLRGLIAEIQLKSAVIQYQYINRIAPLIENSILSDPQAERILDIDEAELHSFERDATQIELAAKTILENKIPLKIKGAEIDWDIFASVKAYTEALKLIINSVRLAINAMQSDIREDKIVNWNEAKEKAQRTADILAKTQSKEAKQLAEQVFGLTQLYRSFENAIREGKTVTNFPVDGIITLVQELVMGI